MSSPEDNKFDFEDLKLPDDFTEPLEPSGEPPSEQSFSAAAAAELEQVPAEEDKKAKKKAKKEKKRKKEKAEQEELAGAEGEPIQATSKAADFLEKLTTADPFNVMLAIALAAIIIAILCCLVELGRYDFDLRANGAKQVAAAVAKIDAISDVS